MGVDKRQHEHKMTGGKVYSSLADIALLTYDNMIIRRIGRDMIVYC